MNRSDEGGNDERTSSLAGPDRRTVLKTAGATAATVALAGCSAIEGVISGSDIPSDELNAGLLTFTEGAPAVLGVQAQRGVEQAVRRINDEGGIAGRRPVELTVEDETEAPLETYQEFIDNGYDVTFGPIGSDTHEDLAPEIEENEVINVATDGTITTLYEHTVPEPTYSFRFQNYDVMEVVTAVREVIQRLGSENIDTIGGINPGYAFGEDQWELFRDGMRALLDVDVAYRGFPPLGEEDMSEEVGNLAEEQPDVTFTSLWGGDVITFFEEARNTDLFENTTVIGPVLYSAVDEMSEDLVSEVDAISGSRNYYWDQPPVETWPPGEQLFTLASEQDDIGVPTAHYMSGYGAVTAWATAVEKAIDILGEYPSQRQIARVLEGHGFFTPAGYHVIREDHQGMSTSFVGDLNWDGERDVAVLSNISEYAPKNVAPPPGTSADDWIAGW